MLRILTAAILLAAAGPAFADDVQTLDVATAVENWKDLDGQKIRLTGGKVSTVDNALNLAVYGAWGDKTISIDTTGADQTVLNALATACAKPNTNEIADCAYDVIATMGANGSRSKPRLKSPEFVKP